jgi:hypothetical protein
MTALMRAFYEFMIWSTELEQALARHSGNMDNVNRLSERHKYWTAESQRFEWSLE